MELVPVTVWLWVEDIAGNREGRQVLAEGEAKFELEEMHPMPATECTQFTPLVSLHCSKSLPGALRS